MRTIQKTKTIAAPKEKVWAVLLEDEYNRSWFSEFMDGTYADTDWIIGHKVKFTDPSGNGIVGRIHEKQPYDIIHIVYEGIVKDAVEDYDSEEAKTFDGAREIYRLEDAEGATVLNVEVDTDERMYDYMDTAWNRALDRIEELSVAV